jgi:hypothetical protein
MAIAAQKQLWIVGKEMGMTVLQYNFIYEKR